MNNLKPMNWPTLILFFLLPTILNFIACQIAIPALDNAQIFPIEISYFISVGVGVLVPMFFAAIFLTSHEIKTYVTRNVFQRMRVKKLSRTDSVWTVTGFIILVLASYLIAKIVLPVFNIDATPFFFKNMPLKAENFYILFVWPLFFFFNILGEEFYWRGYIQPRQELLNKKWTWFFHGLLWAFWHLPMGLDLILASLPIFFILPAIVQLRQNTTIAIIIHFVFGAFGFLSLALGMLH